MVIPKPFWVISRRAACSGWSAITEGISSPLCIISPTRSSSLRPKAPPGWEKAKSSAVNPRASRSAIASASPITKVTVVLVVGAKFRGQASLLTDTSRFAQAA